ITAWIQPTIPPKTAPASTPSHGAYGTPPTPRWARSGASTSWAVIAAAMAPKSMMPSRAMFTTPERSLNRPPSAANRSGVVARTIDANSARSTTVSTPLRPLPRLLGERLRLLALDGVALAGMGEAAPEGGVHERLRQEPARGDEQHYEGEDHAHDLAREVGERDVQDRAAVLHDAEQEGGEQDADGVVAREQGHGDAVEAVAGGARLPEGVVLEGAAEDVVGRGEAGETAREGHRDHGGARDVRAGVLGGAGRQAHGPELEPEARLEQQDVDEHGHQHGDEEARVEVRGRDGRRQAVQPHEDAEQVGRDAHAGGREEPRRPAAQRAVAPQDEERGHGHQGREQARVVDAHDVDAGRGARVD